MNCPVCSTGLQVVERQSVEIDFCPRCRGVWLDRGELDKIIERSSQYQNRDDDDDDDSDWGDDRRSMGRSRSEDHRPGSQYPAKKREGFFGRLFDFD